MDLWAFGTSPHGLGLSDAQFWYLSRREFNSLRKIWKTGRDFQIDLYSGLQSSMHNLWSSGGRRYTPDDFNGKEKQQQRQTWQQDFANLSQYACAMGGTDYTGLPKEDKEQVVSSWLRRAYEHRVAVQAANGSPPEPSFIPMKG